MTALATMVLSTASRSSDELMARPVSSSTFSLLTDWARSRVRSSTFCSRRVGFLQLARHPVEMVGEFLHLVACPHLDAVTEFVGPELARAGLQLSYRNDH